MTMSMMLQHGISIASKANMSTYAIDAVSRQINVNAEDTILVVHLN